MDENKCPDCGGRMKARTNSKDGAKFWGCAAFPQCTGTRDSMGRSAEDRRREIEEAESGTIARRSRRYD